MKPYLLAVYITLLMLSTSIANAETIRWVTESWQNYTNKDGSGLYNDILRSVFADHQLEVTYMPWKRTLLEVKNGTADITGATSFVSGYITSQHPILAAPISVLLNSNKISYKDITSLTNYNGVWPSPYKNEFFFGLNKALFNGFSVQDRETAYKLLVSGRADYFLDTKALHLAWLEKKATSPSETMKNYDFQMEDISQLDLYMIFTDNARGQRLKDIYDNGIDKLIQNDELRKLYEKYHFLEQIPDFQK
ncbi:ABC transporter substrate-binding protein [Paraglaciecola sp. L3A3]|uniref:substrate-binding periplasmic protein n=1 Tax=Paraglaciecola sp. L3A3 TaxID=2686358 RepID=UPI00131C89A5|nr:transporter substrate-binding domain-containing protein [Paraglaciecola sp. L3A3]